MRATRLASTILYFALQVAVQAYLLARLLAVAGAYLPWIPGLYPFLLATGLAVSSLALRGLSWAAGWPVLLWVAFVSITGAPTVWVPLAVLASVPLARAGGGSLLVRETAGAPKSRPARAARALAVMAGLAVAGAGVLYAAYKLYMLLPSSILPRAGGDLPGLYQALGGTLLFHVVALSAAVYLAYRALEVILSTLVYALARPPSLPDLEVLGHYRKWRDTLVGMRGRQYGVLRWAQLFLLTTLLSPVFMPVTRTLVLNLVPLQGRAATVAYILLGYALGWLFTRTLTAGLIDHPRPDQLLHPGSVGARLMLGLGLAGTIIILYAAAGGDPVQPVLEALTGKPMGEPALAKAVGIEGLEQGVIAFAKLLWGLLEGAVRFLWGG